MTTTMSRPAPAGAAGPAAVTVHQYSRRAILAIWAAAALPMAALAWIVAPAVAGGSSPGAMFRPLVVLLTAGLVWQFVLVLGLVGYEQRSLRWRRVKPALWLQRPVSPKTGRSGGRTWLVLVPLVVAFGLVELLPSLSPPVGRDFGEFLSSDAGRAMFHGSWGWFAVVVTLFVFNTVLGEELLFRGVLLPRMAGAYGDRDWVVNGCCSPATTCTCPGPSSPAPSSTCSCSPTRPGATGAPGSASPCTAPRAWCSPSWCSPWSCRSSRGHEGVPPGSCRRGGVRANGSRRPPTCTIRWQGLTSLTPGLTFLALAQGPSVLTKL